MPAGDRVDVEIDRDGVEAQVGDAGLLGRLAQRRAGQRRVRRLAVSAELQPCADPAVQAEQHAVEPAATTSALAVTCAPGWSRRVGSASRAKRSRNSGSATAAA